MGIVLILLPVSLVQASDMIYESQSVTSEVFNESESESLDLDENESMETQSEVAETSIESTVQSERDNEIETSANDVENEMFQQIGATSGNMIGSYIECENGGINNADNPSEYIIGDNDIILKVPTKQGYTFEGWYLDSDYQTPITVIPADTAKEYVLYAKWTENNKNNQLADENKDVLPDGEYIVRSAVDHAYVMDVQWASQENSANVQVYENNGTDAQVWQISHDADHYVIIRSKNSGKVLSAQDIFASAMNTAYCLDLSGAYAANEGNVQVYETNGTLAQQWSVVKK